MRVQALVGRDVLKAELGAGEDILHRDVIPGIGLGSVGLGRVDEAPHVVVILVGVQGDLLL